VTPVSDDTKFYIIEEKEGHFVIKDKSHQRYLRFENDFSEVVQACSSDYDAEWFIIGPLGSPSLAPNRKFNIRSSKWQNRYLRADSNPAVVNQKRHLEEWEKFICIPWSD